MILIAFAFLNNWADAQDGLLPDTTRVCYADSLMLDAGPGFTTYQWSNGDNTQTTWVSNDGLYSVIASGDTTIMDSTYVTIFEGFIVQADSSINCGDAIVLSGNSNEYNYLWFPGGSTDSSIVVYPKDTTTYFVTISDPVIPSKYCIDSVKVSVKSLIKVDTIIQLNMGCKGDPQARVKIDVSGGYPGYSYEWPSDALFETDTSIAFGLRDGEITINVTDSIGCSLSTDFMVKSFPIPDLDLFAEPTDTVYLQKPYITFSYENPEYDSLGTDTFYLNWSQWNFGDGDSSTFLSPTHTYPKAGTFDVLLKFRTSYNCYGEDSIKVVVKPVKLLIPAVFTPNGDGTNDKFEIWNDDGTDTGGTSPTYKAEENDPIDLSEYYLSNTLVIFNRWGEKVYEVDNYQNDWQGENLVDGIYFYVLKCHGEHGDDVYKGSVMILTKMN